jgi:enoyl-CoA hydratase
MVHENLNIEKTGHIMVVTIADDLDSKLKMVRLRDEMTELCAEIVWDEDIRIIILTGAGEKSFTMGTNLTGIVARVNEELEIELWSITKSIPKLDRPVIAAITVDAIGQGLELALACDIRIASETSHFGLPQIKYGLIPEDGGTQRLSRLVGNSKALEMILTGEMIDAQEAFRIGLVNKVVSPDKVMTVVVDMANEMASKGTIAVRYAKEAIYKGMDMTLEQGLRLEADLYLLIHTTRDRVEGIKAFREKRPPKFEGK